MVVRREARGRVAIKVTIDSREVKNPLAKAIIALVGVVILLVLLAATFFLALPLIWFVGLSMLMLVLALSVAAPTLVSRYRVFQLKRRTLEKKN